MDRWSAPEVLKYHKYYPKSDVWSFGNYYLQTLIISGIVIWEVYSKCVNTWPYNDLKNDQCIQFVLDGKRLEPPSLCPSETVTWMLKCWADKHQDRPSFAELHLGLLGEDTKASSSLPASLHATVNNHSTVTVVGNYAG
jgi:serine/threonine protein kinase